MNTPKDTEHAREPRRAADGTVLTDEAVQRLVDEAEAGYDVATLRRRGGRRPMGRGPAAVVPVRLDPDLRAALAARAEQDHTSTSDIIRQALRAWLDVA